MPLKQRVYKDTCMWQQSISSLFLYLLNCVFTKTLVDEDTRVLKDEVFKHEVFKADVFKADVFKADVFKHEVFKDEVFKSVFTEMQSNDSIHLQCVAVLQ